MSESNLPKSTLGTIFPFQPQPSKWQELLAIVETKNSWGKNELKEEILKILVKYER